MHESLLNKRMFAVCDLSLISPRQTEADDFAVTKKGALQAMSSAVADPASEQRISRPKKVTECI